MPTIDGATRWTPIQLEIRDSDGIGSERGAGRRAIDIAAAIDKLRGRLKALGNLRDSHE
jgi:hypothetical protein